MEKYVRGRLPFEPFFGILDEWILCVENEH